MSIEVELPDGTIVEFPDGASSGFISTILKRNSVEGKPLFRSIGGVQARQQEIRAVDSNKPSMDSFLNFMSGGFKPDIQGGDRLSNIGQYAAEDLSQLAEFGLGGVANFANNANQNQDNSVMDTVIAGAELIPSGALASKATSLAGKGASRLFSEALDQSLRSPMTNQAGTIGVKASKGLMGDDAGIEFSSIVKSTKGEPVRAVNAAREGVKQNSIDVYHSTGADFTEFDPSKGIGGQMWFTSSKDLANAGYDGAAGGGRTVTAKVDIRNPAGWNEYDKYSIDELMGMGYDGLKLQDGNEIVYNAFFPEQVKVVTNKANK
jgi:hypothetical protein